MSDDESDTPTDGQVESEENGECFVIAPIGELRSEIRRRTDGLLDEVVRPVVGKTGLGLSVTAAHELPEAGSITKQMIQRLLTSDLVVADLTDLNPNVMYELAVRHARGEPVVPIADRSTNLPFDLKTERTVFYEESFHGLKELKPQLEDAVLAALEDSHSDNPVYRAQQDFQMREVAADDDAMQYVMDRLDDIESTINSNEGWTGADLAEKDYKTKVEKLQQELDAKTERLHMLESKLSHLEEERRKEEEANDRL